MGNLISKQTDANFDSNPTIPIISKELNEEIMPYSKLNSFKEFSLFNPDAERFENFGKMHRWRFDKSADWYPVVQNGYSIKLSETGMTLPTKKYSISFIYNLQATHHHWNNIFHISNDGSNYSRSPAMWVIPGTTHLHLRISTNSWWNDGLDTNHHNMRTINLHEQVLIVMTVDNNVCTIYYDGVNVVSKRFNNIHEIRPDATLFIGEPWSWNNGKINIKNFTLYDGVLSPRDIDNIYKETRFAYSV